MIALLVAASLVAALAAAFVVLNRDELFSPGFPILLYHRFIRDPAALARYPGTESIFTITAERFEEQLLWLKGRGFQPIGLRQVHDFLATGGALPPRPLLICVDDGWSSNLDVMVPLLRKHGLPASFFVTTSPDSWIYRKFAGLDAPLSLEQVRALHRDGYEIGSHSVTHPHLIELDDDAIRREFTESKRQIEAATGAPCDFLSIPGNFYDARVMRIARECGYRAVFTAEVGTVRPGTDRFTIPRLIVEGNFALDEFEKNLEPATIATRRLIFALKKLPPKLFGATRYVALREWLFATPLRHLFIMRRLKAIVLALVLLLIVLVALAALR